MTMDRLARLWARSTALKDTWANSRGYSVTPEMLGAAAVGDPAVDEKVVLDRTFAAAAALKVPVLLKRLYYTSGNTLGGVNAGFTIEGMSGVSQKRSGNIQGGFRPFADGQDFVVRLGVPNAGATIYTNAEQFLFRNVSFEGGDYTVNKGVVHAPAATQGMFDRCSFRHARGTGLYANKLEDVWVLDCQFEMLGANTAKPGGICFADLAAGSTIGSNHVRIQGNRFEFIDGPHIGYEPGCVSAWASSVFIDFCKFEPGQITTSNDGTPVTYGSFAASYGIIDFRGADGESGNRTTVRTTNWFISNASAAAFGFAVGDCDDFVVRNGQMSAGNSSAFTLARLEDRAGNPCNSKNVFIDPPNVRETGGAGTQTNTYEIVNKSYYPISYSMPIDAYKMGPLLLSNENASGSMSLSKYGAAPSGTGGVTSGRRCVPDPAPTTDPCISPANSVMATYDNAGTDIAFLSTDDKALNKVVGLSGLLNRKVRVWVRAKASSVVLTRVIAISDTGGSKGTSVNLTATFSWVSIDIDLATCVGPLRLRANGAAGQIIYVDQYYLEWITPPITATTAQLASLAAAVNTSAFKQAGLSVFNTNTGKPVYATGTGAAAVWNDAIGVLAHTPV